MKKTVPGIEIPEGESCSFSDGSKCALFNWGLEGPAFCAGWGGLNLVGDGLKHAECLALCEIIVEKPISDGEKDLQIMEIPSGYKGIFSVKFFPHVQKEIIPHLSEVPITKEGDSIILTFTEEVSIINLCVRDILAHTSKYNFVFDYREIMEIRNKEGNLLWKNPKCQ